MPEDTGPDWDNWSDPFAEARDEPVEVIQTERRRKTECLELSTKYLYRRAFSETSLIDAIGGIELKPDTTYNFITAGDVDALSYLKIILRNQDLDYLLFSSWVMVAEDILQMKEWHEAGKLKIIDAYLGEIFPNQYRIEYRMLKNFIPTTGGRLAYFRNHSKIFAGYGNKFHFGIQTSANINTNPRTENGSITTSKEIYEFYKQYYDGITGFKTKGNK